MSPFKITKEMIADLSDERLPELLRHLLEAEAKARGIPGCTARSVWAVLGNDAQQWPYKIEDVLARLGKDPVVGSDPRLAELRRRRQR